MNSKDIREKFLSYFEGKGHRRMRSHPLIPPDDPTLLFVNAGMVQFKDVFTGSRDIGTKRAATSQKCLRVSGKHNDLEQVGRTSRHHTFFEMLGNFSFGDYFKREAIEFAWELMTVHYGINPDLLWVTVHPDDAEASGIWRDAIGVREGRIYSDPSNFWAMGETGPCGPCSEIHIDRGNSFPGKSIAEPGERFVELWNLVFMQFERSGSGELRPLPAPSIDTGMGLERLASVLQGKRSNYETDLFMPLIDLISGMSGRKFGSNEEDDTAMRVISDHARATAFLMADSIFPENEGRGYVLRRLMRRAIRFGRKLELEAGFFKNVCGRVVEEFSGVYNELGKAGGVIGEMVSQEEERFSKTLSEGMRMLKDEIGELKKFNRNVISGRVG
ncbi:MAG: alanine--tRNA ligase, partial [Deltaproteobacteria bacterium]|nr:alanine--tRNA ligase [Deltaproteobacteria bacterium]